MKNIKKILVGVLMGILIVGSTMSIYAATFITSDAMKTTTSSNLQKTFSKKWSIETELCPVYEGEKWPVMITCGYDTFLVNEDYVKNVGGTATGYISCGFVMNSGA